MNNRLQIALDYLRYYFSASNGKGHGIHSPFIFHFITSILNDPTHFADYDKVEKLRTELLNDKTILEVEDFGAGSSRGATHKRSIESITKHAAKSPKYAQLLYRMVRYYQPANILELGTSLGITTSYLSLANPLSVITTLEGAPEIAKKATRNFDRLALSNIKTVTGPFDNTLPGVLAGLPTIDFAFVDGNHRKEPTLRYFNQLLNKTNNESILVFDDIHWSPEMKDAWKLISTHENVRCSIDLFFIGIVFFRQEFRERQQFVIRF